jgi:hypothetical protein
MLLIYQQVINVRYILQLPVKLAAAYLAVTQIAQPFNIPVSRCAIHFLFEAKLCATEAKFFSLRSETGGFISLYSH